MIIGYLDQITRTGLFGWARGSVENPWPEVDLYVNGAMAQSVRPLQERFKDSGMWEFLAQWEQPLTAGDMVEARLKATGEPIPGLTADSTNIVAGPQLVGHRQAVFGLYSHKYNYAFYYHPKSACTLARSLFLELHGSELTAEQRAALNRDALHLFFPPPRNIAPLQTVTLVRNPYTRLVSAFLDKVASWVYSRELCTAQSLFAWRFGADESRYEELTFMDFLQYLVKYRYCTEMHLQAQARLQGAVVCRTESLGDDLLAFYQQHIPELAPQVSAFLARQPALVNPSMNTALHHKEWVADADRLPLTEIARSLNSGKGFDPGCFINQQNRDLVEQTVKHECSHYGYRFPFLQK